jgi:hypothetical protein
VKVIHGKKTTAIFQVSATVTLSNKEIKQKIQRLFGNRYDIIKLNRGQNTDVNLNSSAIRLQDGFDQKNMPPSKVFELLLTKQWSLNDPLSWLPGNSKYFKKAPRENYRFRIVQTGWINCDRLMDVTNANISMVLTPEKDLTTTVLLAQLVFLRSQSIIYGQYAKNSIRFTNVPPNEPMQLICVGVKDDQVVACIRPITTSTQVVCNLDLNPVTPEQFKQRLETLFIPGKTTPDADQYGQFSYPA